MGKPLFTVKQFLEAIPGTGGIVTAIARKVGCNWDTARKYIDMHPTLRAAWQAECETITDLAEVKLIEAIKDGDGQMIRYYLSTKGKGRGYTEQHLVQQEVRLRVQYGNDDPPPTPAQAAVGTEALDS